MNDHSLRIYDSMLGLLSSVDNPTPLVRLNRVVPFEHTQVYAKLEWYNPFGAIKDRVAASMISDAQERGVIGEGQQLVEPTSGNTGLGLAMIANANGYSLTAPLSNQIPQEKRTMLRFFGTDVLELEDTLCPAPGAPEGAIAKAQEIAEQAHFLMLNQYTNEANPGAHYETTGPEIWRQTEGRVTHFVAGLGTCGTITGTGRYLKEQSADVQVLGVHPSEGHDIPGVRSIRQLQQTQFFAIAGEYTEGEARGGGGLNAEPIHERRHDLDSSDVLELFDRDRLPRGKIAIDHEEHILPRHPFELEPAVLVRDAGHVAQVSARL